MEWLDAMVTIRTAAKRQGLQEAACVGVHACGWQVTGRTEKEKGAGKGVFVRCILRRTDGTQALTRRGRTAGEAEMAMHKLVLEKVLEELETRAASYLVLHNFAANEAARGRAHAKQLAQECLDACTAGE
jgi:hypothetical protein